MILCVGFSFFFDLLSLSILFTFGQQYDAPTFDRSIDFNKINIIIINASKLLIRNRNSAQRRRKNTITFEATFFFIIEKRYYVIDRFPPLLSMMPEIKCVQKIWYS